MKTIYSTSVDEATIRFSSIRPVINKAKKNNVAVLAHMYEVTSRGAVYQHRFIIKYEDGTTQSITAQRLKSFLYIFGQKKA